MPAPSSKAILGIDTCHDRCSVALALADDTILDRTVAMSRGHAERLLPMVEQQLAGAVCDVTDLNGIAVTIGPGGFTGIRVGVTAARALALALNIPLYPVPSLLALATTIPPMTNGASLTAMIPGPRGQAYGQGFHAHACQWVADGAPMLVEREKIEAWSSDQHLCLHTQTPSLAITAARLAWDGYVVPGPAEPLYIRSPDATRPGPNLLAL